MDDEQNLDQERRDRLERFSRNLPARNEFDHEGWAAEATRRERILDGLIQNGGVPLSCDGRWPDAKTDAGTDL